MSFGWFYGNRDHAEPKAVSHDDPLPVTVLSGEASLVSKGQLAEMVDDGSHALSNAPQGATYALIQVKGASISWRLDGSSATRTTAEFETGAGGSIELTSADEIANFRFVALVAATSGTLAVNYKGPG